MMTVLSLYRKIIYKRVGSRLHRYFKLNSVRYENTIKHCNITNKKISKNRFSFRKRAKELKIKKRDLALNLSFTVVVEIYA